MKVRLGPVGQEVFWHVLDADTLEGWLERRPWLVTELPFVAWIPQSAKVGSAVLDGAQRLFALQGGHAWWTFLGAFAPGAPDLRQVLAEWAQISPQSDRELADSLGASLVHRPRVFVAELRSPTMLLDWRETLARLTELTQKLRNMPLCCVLAVSSTENVDLGVTRLDLAWPETLRRLRTEDDRWASYLHERVAWHVSGHLDAAVDMFDSATEIRRGDDQALERVFTEHAQRRLAMLPETMQRSLLVSIAALDDHPELRVPAVVPGAGDARRPAPWLARALLLRRADHPQRRFLRAAVTCRPMAMRLLGRCIDLEARIKDLAVDYLVANVRIPDRYEKEMTEAFERIHGRRGGIESVIAPPGHPLPDHPWEMATLGTIEHFARDLVPRVTSEVRWVRNALAHGAPVGWAAFNVVERFEEALIPDGLSGSSDSPLATRAVG